MPEREIGTKSIGAMEFTDDEKGEVRAVVYTLGVVDRDGEVMLPETFQGEARVKLSEYGHSAILAHAKGSGNPVKAPVGKGVLRVNANNEMEFVGKYFMSTTRGRDAYFTAKEMGPEQEWSVTFWRDKGEPPSKEWQTRGARRIWRSPIEPFEVSPVTVAGGVGTRTVGVKAADVTADVDSNEVEAEQALVEQEEAAKRAKEEADAAAEAARKAEEDARAEREAQEATTRAEAERVEAERQAQAAEAARVEAERKAAEEAEAATKARAVANRAEYERVQRALGKMGLR